jgi:5-oxoprolinase (ATP-hydrolysing) subunit C
MPTETDADAPLAHLTVSNPGLYSLLVDFGWQHSRSLGVPVGGAADRTALSIGNALLGNAPDAVALEIGLAGPTLRADAAVAAVVYGAPFALTSDRQPLVASKTFTLAAGEELRVGGTAQGMRAYLCVRGGFHAPCILDSHSALAPLQAGAVLTCIASRTGTHFVKQDFNGSENPHLLRVISGRQADWFEPDALYHQEYSVRPESNRMGLRLEGQALAFPSRELLSEPVCPGSVQVTRDGQCIVLGRDGQTIGGYPKIAQVISADLDKLAQLRPGTIIRFERVPHNVAELLYRDQVRELQNWLTRLRTAAVGGC